MKTKILTSIRKCFISFTYAKNGVRHVVVNENNFTYHFIATILVLGVGYFLKLSNNEWVILTILIGNVYVAEIFNTAIEKIVDLISPQKAHQAGLIKDIAAGGVLIASLISAISGLILFLGKLF
ncbi:MAG: diacylglycerol kinase family protein [Bacteroidota bacterium]|nr:diacylglycerol kinase family protein [Bacteroidota bacterium]